MELIGTMNLLNRMFSYGKFDKDPEFWLDLLQTQLDEAKQHLANGNHYKMQNELCDTVLVAWNAIQKLSGDMPELRLLGRIDSRIIDHVPEIVEKYKNGYIRRQVVRDSQS